jgi:hypothetical protein
MSGAAINLKGVDWTGLLLGGSSLTNTLKIDVTTSLQQAGQSKRIERAVSVGLGKDDRFD